MGLIQDVQRKVEEAGGDEERGVELNHMGLTEVSDGVAELLLRVRKLSLTGNMLTDLPPLMGHMTQLRYLDLSNNALHNVPAVVTRLTTLEILDVSYNQVEAFPEGMLRLTNLMVLSFSHNKLRYVPSFIADMAELRLMEIDGNPFVDPPPPCVDPQAEGVLDWVEEVKEWLRSKRTQPQVPGTQTQQQLPPSQSQTAQGVHTTPPVTPLEDDPISSRQAKRMGVIVKKYRSTSSHARGASHDSAIGEPVQGQGSSTGAYFKRLSTLPEERKNNTIEACRKILFAFSEILPAIKTYSGFCKDRKLVAKAANLHGTCQQQQEALLAALERYEETVQDATVESTVVERAGLCVGSLRRILALLHSNIAQFASADIRYSRLMLLSTFGSLSEVHNAWHTLFPPNEPDKFSTVSPADRALYEKLISATNCAQNVLGQLTEFISKSAAASAHAGGTIPPHVTVLVKELTSTCVAGADATRQVRQRLDRVARGDFPPRQQFLDTTSYFLKVVIAMLAATRQAMDDLPILGNASAALGTLTKLTKEIAISLEYKPKDSGAASGAGMGGAGGLPTATGSTFAPPTMPAVIPQFSPAASGQTTPLVAALGPAASVVEGFFDHHVE
ncbi:Leucine-rich repeat-containing protein [Yarrowia sp. C11]|nr:Leucine-rich repeat-containing protein [Yarrowia sp. C11]KAG5364458.1 Leucine-rich repeat-containing protein [Yarrowia sp. E02]